MRQFNYIHIFIECNGGTRRTNSKPKITLDKFSICVHTAHTATDAAQPSRKKASEWAERIMQFSRGQILWLKTFDVMCGNVHGSANGRSFDSIRFLVLCCAQVNAMQLAPRTKQDRSQTSKAFHRFIASGTLKSSRIFQHIISLMKILGLLWTSGYGPESSIATQHTFNAVSSKLIIIQIYRWLSQVARAHNQFFTCFFIRV